MTAKATIQSYPSSDQPIPPFHETSPETISHIRVTVERTNQESFNSLFYSILHAIHASPYNRILTQTNAQTLDNQRFCMDFHLRENNKKTVNALMGLIDQHLKNQKGLSSCRAEI